MIKETNERLVFTITKENKIKLNFLIQHFKTKTATKELNSLIDFMYNLVNNKFTYRETDSIKTKKETQKRGVLPDWWDEYMQKYNNDK